MSYLNLHRGLNQLVKTFLFGTQKIFTPNRLKTCYILRPYGHFLRSKGANQNAVIFSKTALKLID